MKVQIIGVGVVGTAQAYLASRLGHEVLGFDRRGSTSDYYTTVKEPARNVDLTFVCTPESAVEEVVGRLVQTKVGGLYVIKSTVPPGTTQKLMEKCGIHIGHNPEFLRESRAFDDVTHPHWSLLASVARRMAAC